MYVTGITEVALFHAHGHTQYVHIYKYFQESESCLPSIPSRRELLQIANEMQMLLQVHTMQFILHRNV